MPDDGPRPPVSLAAAIRAAFRSYLDDIVVLFLANVAWVLLLVAFGLARAIVPILLFAAPLLALPTAVLMRMAVASARDEMPRWRLVGAELGRLAGRKLLLATVQLGILALGITNVVLSGAIGGLPGVLSAVVAGYAVIVTVLYATALWPIVCDPVREAPLTEQLRLALAVVVLRPLQTGVLALLTALAVVVSAQLIVPVIFLPSLILLAVAWYVVPTTDRLRPMDA